MNGHKQIFSLRWIVFTALFFIHHSLFVSHVAAQTEVTDSIVMAIDSMYNAMDLAPRDMIDPAMDSLAIVEEPKRVGGRDWASWRPDPQRALWLALVVPGGGQIYNRKFWKLPLIYGGFMGCFYALSWNNTMYRDYAQAYIDIMDDDPNTRSYENFIPLSYDVNANLERLQTLFKKKKDYYRRYRDLSIFCAIGVYALSIIDAYVDAELSSFDISKDLSMKVKPSVINDRATASYNGNSYGIKCAITF